MNGSWWNKSAMSEYKTGLFQWSVHHIHVLWIFAKFYNGFKCWQETGSNIVVTTLYRSCCWTWKLNNRLLLQDCSERAPAEKKTSIITPSAARLHVGHFSENHRFGPHNWSSSCCRSRRSSVAVFHCVHLDTDVFIFCFDLLTESAVEWFNL